MVKGEVDPKHVWLTKSSLALVVDTTCGAREMALTNVYSDEAQKRRSAANAVGGGEREERAGEGGFHVYERVREGPHHALCGKIAPCGFSGS